MIGDIDEYRSKQLQKIIENKARWERYCERYDSIHTKLKHVKNIPLNNNGMDMNELDTTEEVEDWIIKYFSNQSIGICVSCPRICEIRHLYTHYCKRHHYYNRKQFIRFINSGLCTLHNCLITAVLCLKQKVGKDMAMMIGNFAYDVLKSDLTVYIRLYRFMREFDKKQLQQRRWKKKEIHKDIQERIRTVNVG